MIIGLLDRKVFIMKMYVLVSQGLEIFRTRDKQKALDIMNKENDNYSKYLQDCYDNHVCPADNEITMFDEDI